MGGRGQSSMSSGMGSSFGDYDEFSALVDNDEWRDETIKRLNERGLNGYSTLQMYADMHNDYGKPDTVATRGELQGEVFYRGVENAGELSAGDIIDSFIFGDEYWIGQGTFGDGTYFSNDYLTANDYAHLKAGNIGRVFAASLKPSAKVVDYDELMERAKAEHRNIYSPFFTRTISSYARSLGYQVIKAKWNSMEDYYVVLDRSAITVALEY